jgi:hypothetical protein
MSWAMEKVAELFRLFYHLVDKTAPVVSFVTSFGEEGSAVLKPAAHLAASGSASAAMMRTDFFESRGRPGRLGRVPVS